MMSASFRNLHTGQLKVSWSSYLSYSNAVVSVEDTDTQLKWTVITEGSSLNITVPCNTDHHEFQVVVTLVQNQSSAGSSTVDGFKVVSILTAEESRSDDLVSSFGQIGLTTTANSILHDVNLRLPAYRPSVSIQRSTYRQAAVMLPRHLGRVDRWEVTITKTDTSSYLATTTSMIFYIDAVANISRSSLFEFPLWLDPGKRYKVTLVALKNSIRQLHYIDNYAEIGQESVEFKTVLTSSDLQVLHKKAVEHCGGDTAMCLWLYRNKSNAYFSDVFTNHRGLMKVYAKDNSGDPASSINGQINGLFFLANVEDGSITGEPRRESQFGSNRIQIPARVLLELAGNLYFADYYCMRGWIHYVTIVMTKPGSSADNFCREHLLQLDLRDKKENPFFFEEYGQLYVSTSLTIELLYTEDIDINYMRNYRGAEYTTDIPTIGKGSSTPGGIPKKRNCYSCNVYSPFPSSGELPLL